MTTPKKIYLSQNPITVEPYDEWQKTKCESSDVTYFSEQAVREILKQVVNDANTLIDISTTVHKTKLDADLYIPHIIELLMKEGEK